MLRELKESKDHWAQQEKMENQALVVPLEAEEQMGQWDYQDQKASLVMLGRLERLAPQDLQEQGD